MLRCNTLHGLSGRANNGASNPRTVEVIRTTTPANPVEYHASDANGVVGSENAHATYAMVPAAISHRGHFKGAQGMGLPVDFALVMYTSQMTSGVTIRNHQKIAQLGLATASFVGGWRAARTAT